MSHGHSVVRTREPGGTWLGEKVRHILLDPAHQLAPMAELALFLASRAQQLNEVILPALKQGKIVLCDRFNDSSVAYQGAARNLGEKQVETACNLFCQGVEPKLTIYLDIDPILGLSRAHQARAKDRIEQEEISFHQTIRAAYHTLAKRHHSRIRVIDASESKEAVFKAAIKAIEEKLHV